jgi:uncharacterized protein YdcH (DUF465 family)
MEIFKNIATVVGCISACMALSIAIIKPLRQSIIDSFVKESQNSKRDEKIDQMDKKIDKLLEKHQKLEDRITSVEENVLENEADRIRAELFDCGNRCRRGIRLHPEEMEHIRAVFKKYSEKLQQNGTGSAEMDFITDYYNHQAFPEYHTHN